MLNDAPLPDEFAIHEEKKHAETPFLQQGVGEIGKDQLSLRKRLLNWRTIVPLVIVLALLAYLAQKAHINPQQTWATVKQANILFFLAAFLCYYASFPLRALRWRLLLENVGFTKENAVSLVLVKRVHLASLAARLRRLVRLPLWVGCRRCQAVRHIPDRMGTRAPRQLVAVVQS